MSLDLLKRDIENKEFHRIYYLYGAEPYLKRFYLKSLISAILPDNVDTDLHRYEGKGLDANNFSEELWLCPLGEYKVIQINDLPCGSPVWEFLTRDDCEIGEDTVVIIYQQTESPDRRTAAYKAMDQRLKKDGLWVEIKTVDEDTLSRWVVQQFHRLGRTIAPKEVEYFLSVEERNMESMLTEIHKIAAYCKDEVTCEALEKLCVKTVQARAYEMNDLLLEKDADGVFSVLKDLNALKTPPQMILGSLYSCFGTLYKLKKTAHLSEQERMDLIGQRSPYQVRKYDRYLSEISEDRLDHLMELCGQIDVQSKTTKADPSLLIVQLLSEALELL